MNRSEQLQTSCVSSNLFFSVFSVVGKTLLVSGYDSLGWQCELRNGSACRKNRWTTTGERGLPGHAHVNAATAALTSRADLRF